MNVHVPHLGNIAGSRHTKGARSQSPQSMVQQHYDDAECDKARAKPTLLAAAKKSAVLLEYLIDKGADAALANVRHSDNAKIYTGNANAPVRFTAASPAALEAVRRRALATGRRNVRMLLDTILPNGVRMSLAKAGDLQDAIETYEPQARDMTAKVAYFRLVKAQLPEGKAVGDTLGNEDLTVLFERAQIPA